MVVVLVSNAIGLYDRDAQIMRKTTLEEVPALFSVATLYALLIYLLEDNLVKGFLGRDQVLGLWGLLFLMMTLGRTLARLLARQVTATERCLVLGDAVSAGRLWMKLGQCPSVKADVIGRIPIAPESPGTGSPVLGTMADLEATLTRQDVHRVLIAAVSSDSDETLGVIRRVKSLGVRVSVVPRLSEVVGWSAKAEDIDGLTVLGVPRFGRARSSWHLKRTMDVVGSATALVVFSPLMLVIALAIRTTSSGPVLFRQGRVGRNGVEFAMLKFRSMVVGADEQKAALSALNEADGLFKIANDPRITPVGRISRRASLDELPQLINVLRGDMSLVGPRPLVPDDDSRIGGWQRKRLYLTPGMSGLWQIYGSSRIPLEEMVKIDYLYGGNWSIWVDLKILVRTVPHMICRRGL